MDIISHRIHGAAIYIYGNMDPINIPSIYPIHVSIYTSTMDPSWDMMFSPKKPRFPAQRGLPADFLALCTGDACGKGAFGAVSVLRIRLHNPGDETW